MAFLDFDRSSWRFSVTTLLPTMGAGCAASLPSQLKGTEEEPHRFALEMPLLPSGPPAVSRVSVR